VVIASAYRTEDPGFESRKGVRLLGLYTLQCRCQKLNMHCHCVHLRKTNDKKTFWLKDLSDNLGSLSVKSQKQIIFQGQVQ
jgi:hypothetical protein